MLSLSNPFISCYFQGTDFWNSRSQILYQGKFNLLGTQFHIYLKRKLYYDINILRTSLKIMTLKFLFLFQITPMKTGNILLG